MKIKEEMFEELNDDHLYPSNDSGGSAYDAEEEAYNAVHYLRTINEFTDLIKAYGMYTVMMDVFKSLESKEVFK